MTDTTLLISYHRALQCDSDDLPTPLGVVSSMEKAHDYIAAQIKQLGEKIGMKTDIGADYSDEVLGRAHYVAYVLVEGQESGERYVAETIDVLG